MKEILKLKPAYKDYLWGGNNLKTKFNKKCDYDIVAESWELSVHNDGPSIIDGGSHDKELFKDYINSMPKEILGLNANNFTYFPILIKLIDSSKPLSIQVHPDDEYGLKHEGEYGKTEAWYILDAKEDSYLYVGFNQSITKDKLRESIKNNTITNYLNKVKVNRGDVAYIEAGTVHAIGEGITLLEVQQNSNSTYRVYDFDRTDQYGNKRELHIDKAIDVAKLDNNNKAVYQIDYKDYETYSCGSIVTCKYFNAISYIVKESVDLYIDNTSFKIVIVTDGKGSINANNKIYQLSKGDTYFIPANYENITIIGNCEFVLIGI